MQVNAASVMQAARCFVSGEGQIGLQGACAESPQSFPRLFRITPQVVAGGVLVEFSIVAASRWLCAVGHREAMVAHCKLEKRRLREK
jgi:hypothetical protein